MGYGLQSAMVLRKISSIISGNIRPIHHFQHAERAALDFAVAASAVPNAVDESIADALRAHWDEGEIVEIAGVVALFGYLNRWNDSMGTTIESGAIESGEKYLAGHQWTGGKHRR